MSNWEKNENWYIYLSVIAEFSPCADNQFSDKQTIYLLK